MIKDNTAVAQFGRATRSQGRLSRKDIGSSPIGCFELTWL